MMLYNVKLTLRRLFKNLVFSGIIVFGLVIGMSSFFVLFLHVSNEKSFDKHFEGYENIYRISSSPENVNAEWARSLGMVYQASLEIPEVELATQFTHCKTGSIKIGENSFQQKDIMSVDEAFIKIFSVEALVGNLSDLNLPNTVFISEEFARKHFKGINPIGKAIDINALQYVRDLGKYEIRGIVKNTKPKTHFNYELLLSQKGVLQERFTSLPERKIQWTYNYVKIRNGAHPENVSVKILATYNKSSLKQSRGPKDYQFKLEPIKEIHLNSNYKFELKDSSNKINIALFLVISFVILFASLLNFTNLSIAQLINRSTEFGLKKSIGANKSHLLGQILLESFILCSFSIVISMSLVEIIKPIINRVYEIQFNVYYAEPTLYFGILGAMLLCLLFTLIFSWFYLFGSSTSMAISSKNKKLSGNFVLKTLTVMQFAIVIILISTTLLVHKQISFILNKPLGFEKENVVVLHLKDFSKDPAVFANELKKQSQIKSVGFCRQHFGYPAQSLPLEGLGIEGVAEFVFANFDYLETMDIELKYNWIKPGKDTIRGMVMNEHLYNRLMEKHGNMDALNAYQAKQELEPDQSRIKFLGVARDFNYTSAHEPVGDFAFWLDESRIRATFTHIRLNPGDLRNSMKIVTDLWECHYPGQEFSYFFMDERIEQQYKSESMLKTILGSFSIIGILISIIGIGALSLFISQQKTKEIGIRKVNGAKTTEILSMLNLDFVKWVAIAFIVACPIAYYAMYKWLENFAYKTTLSWWVFALAGVLALVVALLTVSWQSWRAATRNPVEALRYE